MKPFILSGLMVFLAAPAFADFEICNETASKAFASIGYKDGDDWVSEGWWTIQPGDCSIPVVGDLENRALVADLVAGLTVDARQSVPD